MKRGLSLLLSLIMLFTFALSGSAFADYDKDLEKAIKQAKTIFNIGDEFDEFEYYINSYLSTVDYSLRWYDSSEKAGGIEVTIDSNGIVKNYYKYNYNQERDQNTLPKINKDEGLKIANEFLKKVNPQLVGKFKHIDDNQPLNVYNRVYYYNYTRIENDIPFYQNSINVSVDNMTGEVQSFNCNWDSNIKFDDAVSIIGLEDGKKAYENKMGLKLTYKLEYSSKEYKPYLVYTSLFNNKAIDAKTGEVVDFYHGFIGEYEDNIKEEAVAQDISGATLSPEEQQAVDKAKDIISKEDAEKTARQVFKIGNEYKLENINLYNDWYNKEDFTWSTYFNNKDNEIPRSINISIDAKTKEIKSFYKYVPYSDKDVVKYDKDQLVKKAEDFIKQIQGDKFNKVEYLANDEPIYRPMTESEKPRQQYFTFIRKVDNAYFQGNGFDVSVDAVTGEVVSYNYTWYKGQLPSTDKTITLEKAYDVLFNKIGIELQYMRDDLAQNNQQNEEQKAKLVYTIKKDKPLNIDAFTGELIYGPGRPYKENTISKYNDIDDSYAKMQIEALAKYGISLPGDEFNPKQNIVQKDFLYLLIKAKGYYFNSSYEDKDFIEKLYKYLINQNIIKENEKSPDSVITREEASKFIVRALGYDKVADINGIYALDFKDFDKISPELEGYVAISTGLGILEGDNGSFNPKANMPREQAAVAIYNILNAK